MLQLSETEFETLRRIVRNGSVALGPECPVSVGVRLELAGLVTLTAPPQRAVPTRAGQVFHHRGAA